MFGRMVACLALGVSLMAPSNARAQWNADPAVNTPVAIGPGGQYAPGGIPDGAGGAFIAWIDARDSAATGLDIWAQHLSSEGVRLWGDSGVPVASIAGDQRLSSLLATGDGGVLVAWNTDETFPPPRVQRLDANGAPLWGPSGVAVTSMAGQHINPRLLAASSGDVFVSWSTTENMSIMAQRLDPDGQRLWGDDGVVVAASFIPQAQRMVPDGAGGMILGWLDWRNPLYGNVFAQRIDGSGAAQWALNGVPVVGGLYEQALLRCLKDGAGGMLLVWQDDRSTEWHVYAQRIGPDGAELWNPAGVEASTNVARQQSPRLVSWVDGAALVSWTDNRSGLDAIFVQAWNTTGGRVWGDGGVPAGSISAAQPGGAVSDGHGGIIVGWAEARGIDQDIFAQRVRTAGQPSFHFPEKLWGANGVVVSSAIGRQYQGSAVTDGVSPDVSGAIFFWQDQRSDGGDIYAQHVQPWGVLGPRLVSVETQSAPPRFALGLAGPQPCRTEAALRLDLPADGNLDLVVLDLQGRRVRSLMRGTVPTGTHPVRWDLRDENGSRVSPGVYFASAQWRDERAGQRIVVLP